MLSGFNFEVAQCAAGDEVKRALKAPVRSGRCPAAEAFQSGNPPGPHRVVAEKAGRVGAIASQYRKRGARLPVSRL